MSDVEFYVDAAGEHRWRVRATNGEEIAAATEGFTSRAAAEDDFRLVENLEPAPEDGPEAA